MDNIKDFIKIADAFGKVERDNIKLKEDDASDLESLLTDIGVKPEIAKKAAGDIKGNGEETTVTSKKGEDEKTVTVKPETDTSQGPADDVAAGVDSGAVTPKEVPADQPAGGEETDGLPAPEEEPEVAAEPEIDPDAPGEDNNTNPDMQRPPEEQPAGGEETDGLPEPEVNTEPEDSTKPPTGNDLRTHPEIPVDAEGNPDWSKVDPNIKFGTVDGVGVERPPEAASNEPEGNANKGDSIANKLNTQAPSLLKQFKDGGNVADDDVKNLQIALSRLGFDPNGIDGKYGQGTSKAVQEFQKKHNLQVDGNAGPATMNKLKELLGGATDTDQTAAATAAAEKPAAEPTKATFDPATVKTKLDRLKELLAKASQQAESKDVRSDDIRSILSMIEGISLTEALNADEMKELEALYNELKGSLGNDEALDAEINAAMKQYDTWKASQAQPAGTGTAANQDAGEPQGAAAAKDPAAGQIGAAAAAGANTAATANDKDGTAPQSDANLDADSADNAEPTDPAADAKGEEAVAFYVERIKPGTSTYADVERAYNALNKKESEGFLGALNSKLTNKFLGDTAKKLGVEGMFKPASSKTGGFVTVKPDTQVPGKYQETGTMNWLAKATGLNASGASEKTLTKLASLNMLPSNVLKTAAKNFPENQAVQQAAKTAGIATQPTVSTKQTAKIGEPQRQFELLGGRQINKTNPDKSKPYFDGTFQNKAGKTITARVYGQTPQMLKYFISKKNPQIHGTGNGFTNESRNTDMSNKMNEASMNISMNGSSASEVAELVGILKNAGVSPKADMPPAPMDSPCSGAKPMPPMPIDKHDDMKQLIAMSDDIEDNFDYVDDLIDEWANEPNEEYSDHQKMTHDLSGGLNRAKDRKAMRVKDPAIESSVKSQLLKALEESGYESITKK